MKKYLLAAFAILLVLVQVTACSKKKDPVEDFEQEVNSLQQELNNSQLQ